MLAAQRRAVFGLAVALTSRLVKLTIPCIVNRSEVTR